MTNYYEILEVSEKASKEVIEKAYRVLAKKYHPDGKPQEEKLKAENKMKQINEAYEILSNVEKRKQYDEELQIQRQMEEESRRKQEQETYERMLQEEKIQEIEQQKNAISPQIKTKENSANMEEEDFRKETAKAINEQIQKAYKQAYNDYWRSRGYKIKEKWTWKKTKEMMAIFIIILLIILFLWFFPPTHELLISFYEDNFIVKAIVDILVNIVKGIGIGIYQFIMKIFGN